MVLKAFSDLSTRKAKKDKKGANSELQRIFETQGPNKKIEDKKNLGFSLLASGFLASRLFSFRVSGCHDKQAGPESISEQ